MWKWFFGALGVALLLVLLVALSVLEILPVGAAIAIALGVLAIVVGAVVYRVVRQRKSGAELEAALASYATHHAQAGRPDRTAEREELEREFKKAIAALRASKLGRKGGSVVYTLPWYVILGPPGTGKTEALRSSGLKFPYLTASRSGAIRGLGGTRNCDWWFTNDAILLDTAGRWSTHAEDHEEWLGFLGLLAKHRPKSPLNGVIVAVSLSDLAAADEAGTAEIAQKLRARLDEALSVLAISVPVYLLVTKCDLLPGFVETFGDLSREQRRAPFGFTLPFGLSHVELLPRLEEHLAELEGSVEQRALRRMAEERSLRSRELVFSFPDQLQVIVPKVKALVAHLFHENYYGETPRLRGLYFTSGTQEGRPFDLVMRTMAQGLGLPAENKWPAAPVEKKSYFLEGVFRDVMFPDAVLAGRSASRRRSDTRVAWGVAACVAVGSLVAAAAYGRAWYANRALLGEVASTVERSATALASSGLESPFEAALLAKLGDEVHRLDLHARGGLPWSLGLGMYQGERIRVRLGRHYAWLVRQGVVHRLHEGELAAVEALVARYAAEPDAALSPADYRALSRGLLLHLSLTEPRAEGEPPLDAARRGELVEQLASAWSASLGQDTAELAIVAPTLAFVDRLATDSTLALPRRPELVERVRRVLRRVDPAEAAVGALVAGLEGAGSVIDVAAIVGARAPHLRSDHAVNAAFTRAVYEAHVGPLFAPSGRDPLAHAWILGADHAVARMEPAARRALVHEAYLRRYEAEWHSFVDGLRIEPASSLQESFALLEEMTRGRPSALATVFATVARNVRFDAPASPTPPALPVPAGRAARVSTALAAVARITGGSASAVSFGPEHIRTSFEPLLAFTLGAEVGGVEQSAAPLTVYEEQLLYLRNAVLSVLQERTRPDALRGEVSTRSATLAALLDGRPPAVQSALADVLFPPIDGALGDAAAARARIDAWAYCTGVRTAFRSRALGRYPFAARGEPVALETLTELYHPTTGAIPRFLANHGRVLAGAAAAPSRASGRGAGVSFSGSTLAFLAQSRAITELLFAESRSAPTLALEVRIVPDAEFDRVAFTVGGTRITPEGGFRRVEWPGAEPGAGAALEVERSDGTRERAEIGGAFGLLQLLERGEVVGSAAPSVTSVRFRFGGDRRAVMLELRRADGRPFAPSARRGELPVVAPFRGPAVDAPAEPVPGAPRCLDAP